jgi:tetratricopeptide (TPR) repeat protein
MERKNYPEAVIWFRKYVTNKGPNDNNDRVFDAYLCMGDGYFRMSDFINAAEFYGKAVAVQTTSPFNKDYALYQQAMAYGYLGKKEEKAASLKKMREEYPSSDYLANGRYQEARTLHELKEYDRALTLYNEVYMQEKNKKDSKFSISCLTNMGSIYRIKGDYDNALEMYKEAANLLRPKGTGTEFTEVMKEIKELYLAKNQLDQWETYASTMGYQESQVVADSTAYAQAAKMYNAGNCKDAIVQANKYIQRYPSGIYITEVQYMRAECSYKSGDTTSALGSYNAVLEKGQTKYTDISLKRAGYIYYTRKDWSNAARIYSRLANEGKNEVDRNDAKVNAMRTYLFARNIDSADVYANKVLGLSGIAGSVKGEANYIRGKATMNAGDNATARTYFAKVGGLVPNTVYAAEASYQVTRIDYETKPSKGVQAAILKHINDYDAYPEWSGEGWLLLADNYLALKDTAGAKVVLEGYIENGDSPVHVQRAKDKLVLIESGRAQGERKQEELILPMGDPNDQKLFENGQGNGEGGQQ